MGKRYPSSPSFTTKSVTPSIRVATGTQPAAMASTNASPNPSNLDGKMNTSCFASNAGTSNGETRPMNSTLSPRNEQRSRRAGRSGPSPPIVRCATSGGKWDMICGSQNTPLSGSDMRPTNNIRIGLVVGTDTRGSTNCVRSTAFGITLVNALEKPCRSIKSSRILGETPMTAWT